MLTILIIIYNLLISLVLFKLYSKNKFVQEKLSTQDEFGGIKQGERKKIYNSSGIIFYIVFLSNFIIFSQINFEVVYPHNYIYFFILISVITIISFIDDVKPLDPRIRLCVHIVCTYSALTCINFHESQIPLKVALLISVIVWTYYINITNFIDGVDGFCALNSIFCLITLSLISNYIDLNIFSKYFGIILVPILFSFLVFNKPFATLYMGDSGSIFLGYLIGFGILELFFSNLLLYAIVIFIYPLTDCSITLIKKTMNGHAPWVRLGDYFFLKPKRICANEGFDALTTKKIQYKILLYSLFFNILNTTTILISLIYSNKAILILSPLFAITLLYSYNSKKFINY